MKKYEFNKSKFARKLKIDPRNCPKPNSCFKSISFDSLKYVLTYLVCVVSLVLHSKMTHTHAFMHINVDRVVDFIDQVHKNVLRNTPTPWLTLLLVLGKKLIVLTKLEET